MRRREKAWSRCGAGVEQVWSRCGAGVEKVWRRCGEGGRRGENLPAPVLAARRQRARAECDEVGDGGEDETHRRQDRRHEGGGREEARGGEGQVEDHPHRPQPRHDHRRLPRKRRQFKCEQPARAEEAREGIEGAVR